MPVQAQPGAAEPAGSSHVGQRGVAPQLRVAVCGQDHFGNDGCWVAAAGVGECVLADLDDARLDCRGCSTRISTMQCGRDCGTAAGDIKSRTAAGAGPSRRASPGARSPASPCTRSFMPGRLSVPGCCACAGAAAGAAAAAATLLSPAGRLLGGGAAAAAAAAAKSSTTASARAGEPGLRRAERMV